MNFIKGVIKPFLIVLSGIILIPVITILLWFIFDEEIRTSYFPPAETEEQRMIKDNAILLRQAITENVREYRIIALNDLTPFEWDRVLFFNAYASAEAMYETVGYKWDSVYPVAEFETDLVFLLNDKVVCHLIGITGIGIRSEKNELLKESNPKFLVTDMRRRHGTSYRYLDWFDDTLVDIDENNSDSKSLSGQWRSNGNITLYFVVTKEGLVRGHVGHTRNLPEGGHDGSVGIPFMGVLHDNIAQCTVHSIHTSSNYENNSDSQLPIVFDLTYSENEHQFHLFVDFSDKMQLRHADGSVFDIDGEITARPVE